MIDAQPGVAPGQAPHRDPEAIALACTGVSKRFKATVALDDVHLEIESGTIHALVGQNGAGKSTLLGILAGRIAADAGQIRVFGVDAELGQPRAARHHGIVAIYQELTTVPALTAVENVFLGQQMNRAGVLTAGAMNAQFTELCDHLGHQIDPNSVAGRLSTADQQLLEIMRGVQSRARVILFDEPTASLAPVERSALFRLMRDLRCQGVTMVLVSHNLDEVLDIADTVTVFRNGRLQATAKAEAWTKRTLVEAMLGGAPGSGALGAALVDEESTAAGTRATTTGREVVAGVRGLSVRGVLDDVHLTLHRGEILGIAGLVGSGRSTLLRALAGLEPTARGSLTVDDQEVRWPRTVRHALRHGIAMVPEDRKTQGLVAAMSARENIAMGDLAGMSRFGWISRRRMRARTTEMAALFGLDPQRLNSPIRDLSGGNQQKALLARWGLVPPKVLLADEPTRGIDIGAKAEVFRALRDFASRGTAVVFVSSELEEIVALSDRVLVVAGGRVVDVIAAADNDLSMGRLLTGAFGMKDSDD